MRKKKIKTFILKNRYLILILFFALILRIVFFVGINFNDDTEYTHSAYKISIGDIKGYPIGSIDSIRSMMVLPLSLLFFIFGPSDYVAAIYPLICSFGSIFLTFKIGKLLFNEKVGLLASFFLSIIPLDVVYSTQLVPNVQLSFFMMVTVYFFLLGEKEFKNDNLFKKTKSNLYFFLSGIFWGLSYLVNISGILFALIFLSYIIVKKRVRLNYSYIIIGFLIIFLIESTFFFITTKNILWRIKVIHEEEIRVLTNTSLRYYPKIIFTLFKPNFITHEGHFGIFVYMTILSSIYLIIKKDKNSIFLILWMFLLMMYFQFGIMTSNFKLIAKWVRYLIVLLPPSTLIISRSLLTKGVFKKLSIFFMIIILVTTPYYLINTINAHRISTYDFKTIYNFLKNKENKKIYIDYGSLGFVDFYFKYKRDIIPIESLENESEIKDSFVVINGSRGIIENSDMRSKLPEFIKNPSKEWILIKEIDGPEIGIHKTFNPKIYYVK